VNACPTIYQSKVCRCGNRKRRGAQVPGRQTDDGLGRLAGDEAEASVIADEIYGNPCFAKVFADGREIRDLEDSASDVVHREIVMNLLEEKSPCRWTRMHSRDRPGRRVS